MSDPVTFASASPRVTLPLLFGGQAQKEVFINEALSRIDALLHPAVEGEMETSPVTPSDGDCWIVGLNPTGEWEGHANDIACFQAGNWLFVSPLEGMSVYDKSLSQKSYFNGSWQRASSISPPTGGSTEDIEARAAIAALIAVMTQAGILA